MDTMVRMADFIPLLTVDYKIAFCQVTKDLPTLCQENIYHMVTKGYIPPVPNAPLKVSKKLQDHMDRWASRRQISF